MTDFASQLAYYSSNIHAKYMETRLNEARHRGGITIEAWANTYALIQTARAAAQEIVRLHETLTSCTIDTAEKQRTEHELEQLCIVFTDANSRIQKASAENAALKESLDQASQMIDDDANKLNINVTQELHDVVKKQLVAFVPFVMFADANRYHFAVFLRSEFDVTVHDQDLRGVIHKLLQRFPYDIESNWLSQIQRFADVQKEEDEDVDTADLFESGFGVDLQNATAAESNFEINKRAFVAAKADGTITEGDWAIFKNGRLAAKSTDKDSLYSQLEDQCYFACVGQAPHNISAVFGTVLSPVMPRELSIDVSVQSPLASEMAAFKIDTGATACTVTEDFRQRLQLQLVGSNEYRGAFDQFVERPEYFCHMTIDGRAFPCHPVVVANDFLLGTNVLRYLRLDVNGQSLWQTDELTAL